MTRNGKIARLPQTIREQINLRLQNGEEGKSVLEWLNALPVVRSFTTAKFDGQPISDANLSNWKSGGYRDWLAQQETASVLHQIRSDSALFDKASGGNLTDQLGLYFAARLAVAIRRLPTDGESSAIPFEQLRQFFAELSALRKDDHNAQKLEIECGKLDLKKQKYQNEAAGSHDEENKHEGVPEEVIEQIQKELRLM